MIRVVMPKIANSVDVTCKFCALFLADFSTLKISVALLYDPVCHTSILAWLYLVCTFVPCAFLLCFLPVVVVYFIYFITFTPKWFTLAMAAASAKLRAILLYKMCKNLQFLCHFVNSVHDSQFYAKFCTCRIAELLLLNLNVMTL